MKVLITLYKEDFDTSIFESVYSKWVSTDWSIDHIENHFDLHDRFHSQLTVGTNLSFLDIYCYEFGDIQKLLPKIENIAEKEHEEKSPKIYSIFRISERNPGNADGPELPDNKNFFFYTIHRDECGASGFSSAVCWMASHPFEMVFIGGFIYDFCKYVLGLMLKRFGVSSGCTEARPIVFKAKVFYKNFCRLTNLKQTEVQIVDLKRKKTGIFRVIVRTIDDKKYKVDAYASGEIVAVAVLKTSRGMTKLY